MGASENLSKNLYAIRTLRAQSQAEFARELGISKSTFQGIEYGRGPSLATVECIASCLDIPVAVLLSETLPAGQMSVLLQVFGQRSWCAQWPRRDKLRLLRLLVQLAKLLEQHM